MSTIKDPYLLTDRQKQVLRFIIHEITSRGLPPSLREIADHLGTTSFQGAAVHLLALEKKGYIEKSPVARGLRVLRVPKSEKIGKTISIPILGEIQAGVPIFSEQNIEKYLSIPSQYLQGASEAFLLRVRGDSMIEAGINEGDLAIISTQPTAKNGDIVAALVGQEVTLKKFHQIDQYVALIPANPKYKPIIGREFLIQGRCIGLLKDKEANNFRGMSNRNLLPIYSLPKGKSTKRVKIKT